VGNTGSILHFDGLKWYQIPESNADNAYKLNGVWGVTPEKFITVGWVASELPHAHDNAVIGQYDGSRWSFTLFSGVYHLYDVWGSGPDDIYAVGDGYCFSCPSGSSMFHYDGSNWSEINPLNSAPYTGDESYRAIWGSGPNDVYVVGYNGAHTLIIHYNGIEWTQLDVNVPGILNDIWGSGPNDIYVVGDNKLLFHYNGTSWRLRDGNITGDIKGIWGSSNKNIYLVNGTGKIYHYTGINWTLYATGAESLYDIWGSGPNDIVGVGNSGSVVHFDGKTWKKMEVPTTSNLRGVYGSDYNYILAVGENGTILTSQTDIEPHSSSNSSDCFISTASGSHIKP
jgi:hypothetical protein